MGSNFPLPLNRISITILNWHWHLTCKIQLWDVEEHVMLILPSNFQPLVDFEYVKLSK